eukprot:scaffold770_cov255-Pinguiococcus_pyrenoidosus.AAC.32
MACALRAHTKVGRMVQRLEKEVFVFEHRHGQPHGNVVFHVEREGRFSFTGVLRMGPCGHVDLRTRLRDTLPGSQDVRNRRLKAACVAFWLRELHVQAVMFIRCHHAVLFRPGSVDLACAGWRDLVVRVRGVHAHVGAVAQDTVTRVVARVRLDTDADQGHVEDPPLLRAEEKIFETACELLCCRLTEDLLPAGGGGFDDLARHRDFPVVQGGHDVVGSLDLEDEALASADEGEGAASRRRRGTDLVEAQDGSHRSLQVVGCPATADGVLPVADDEDLAEESHLWRVGLHVDEQLDASLSVRGPHGGADAGLVLCLQGLCPEDSGMRRTLVSACSKACSRSGSRGQGRSCGAVWARRGLRFGRVRSGRNPAGGNALSVDCSHAGEAWPSRSWPPWEGKQGGRAKRFSLVVLIWPSFASARRLCAARRKNTAGEVRLSVLRANKVHLFL